MALFRRDWALFSLLGIQRDAFWREQIVVRIWFVLSKPFCGGMSCSGHTRNWSRIWIESGLKHLRNRVALTSVWKLKSGVGSSKRVGQCVGSVDADSWNGFTFVRHTVFPGRAFAEISFAESCDVSWMYMPVAALSVCRYFSFDEAIVKRQVVANRVFPTNSGNGELRKGFLDDMINLREGQSLFRKLKDCSSY